MKTSGVKTISIKASKLLLSAVFIFLASALSYAAPVKAKLTELPCRMAWQLESTDKEGNPSRIIIQGTIHVGDSQLISSIDPYIFYILENADRVYGELSSEALEDMTSSLQKKMIEGYSDSHSVTDSLTEEEKAVLSQLFTEQQLYRYSCFEPWLLTNVITTAIYEASGFSSEYSLDTTFREYGEQNGMKSKGLDTLETQIDILTYGTWEQQLEMLKVMLDSVAEAGSFSEAADSEKLTAMYRAYSEDDRTELQELLAEDEENEGLDFYEDYSFHLYDERNAEWAKEFQDFLYEGGTTFVYAGSAHFLGDKSVFSFMKKAGAIE